MGRISEDDINRVREATDAVALIGEYVQLRQRGREFWGCCPFHNEKTPSFKVNPQTQMWHCFGCGEGGDVFKFMMMKEQFDFPESVRYLANRAGISISEEEGGLPSGYRSRLYAVCEETAAFYHLQLMRGKAEGCARARDYLASRGFGGQVPRKWNLGYAPGGDSLVRYLRSRGFSPKEMVDANVALSNAGGRLRDRFFNRVMFPINDLQGRTIAFGGRVMDKSQPKYINTSNSPLFSKRNNLYGIDVAKSPMVNTSTAIVTEGYTDVLVMNEAGFENTVAVLGTALTPQHVKLLTRFANRIVYLFDGDAAGLHAADRASQLITTAVAPESGRKQVELVVAVIPGDLDPDDYIKAEGADALREVIDGAQPLLRFAIDNRLSRYDLSTPEQRAMALPKVLEPLVPVRDSILSDEYVAYVADVLKMDYGRVRRKLMDMPVQRHYQEDDGYDEDSGWHPSSASGGPAPASDQQPAESKLPLPHSGVGRWEADLLCIYATRPSSRPLISQGMRGVEWSEPAFGRCMRVMEELGPDATPAEAVSACMAEVPEAEMVWSLSPAVGDSLQEVESSVEIMLAEREKASLEDRISDLQNKMKYQDLSPEESSDIFSQITALQKELSDLRR